MDIDGVTVYRMQYLETGNLGGYMCMKSRISDTVVDEDTIIIDSEIKESYLYSSTIINSIVEDSIVSDMVCSYGKIVKSVISTDTFLHSYYSETIYENNPTFH